MRQAEIQRVRGFALDSGGKPANLIRHHHENLPPLDSLPFEDVVEGQTLSWESMWIDVGGEG